MRGPRSGAAWPPSRGRSGRRRRTGTTLATGQAPHAGFCAWQQRRPCQIRWWLSIVQSRLGNSDPTACSALTGSVSSVQPNRRASRPKWVSTVIPGMPKALPSTTLAVLRPTPGSSTRSLSRGGTWPSCRSTRAALSLSSDSVLARKNPSGPMIPSRASRSAAAIAGGVGVGREQGRPHRVDPLVGGLGAQDGHHEQLEGVVEVELALRVGVGVGEHPVDPAGLPHQPRAGRRDGGSAGHAERIGGGADRLGQRRSGWSALGQMLDRWCRW